MIRKIRDFIIGFRFKKYGHKKQREFKSSFDIRPWLRGAMAYGISEIGKQKNMVILSTPVKTEKEKKQKKIALVENIIATANEIIKVYKNI